MLVTTCPRCGKPTPARLASPAEILCAACGYDGPPSDDAAPSLLAAQRFLLGRDARDRQLTAARAKALTQNAPMVYSLLLAVACVPCGGSFAAMVSWSAAACGGPERFGGAVLAALPLAALLVYGARALSRIKRAQAELRAACAAVPPQRRGEPARCCFCGGPLPAGDAVVRCPFCASDNYADPAVVADLQGRETFDLSEYELAIARTEAAARSVTLDERKKAFARGLGIWFLAGYPAVVVTSLVSRIELSTASRGRYAFAPSADGDCLGRAGSGSGSDLDALVGKKVRLRHGGSGVVTRVYATLLGSFAVVSDSDGDSEKVDPFDLCTDPSSLHEEVHEGAAP